MKVGMKEVLLGITLMVLGAYSLFFFFPEVIQLIKGALGPTLLLLGFLITWIGYEDLREGI